MEPKHEPVLLEEVLEWLAVRPGGVYLDGTVGLGGHSRALLRASSPEGFLYGFEWEETSFRLAEERLSREFPGRFRLWRANFAEAPEILLSEGVKVDGALLDLGISSFLLEGSGRGFSFLRDEPLDMRMDTRTEETARDLVNRLSYRELVEILRTYGEEPRAERIARAIVQARRRKPIETSGELARIVAEAVRPRKRGEHPATLTFQALRIAVNRELENLQRFLSRAPEILKPGGRLAIISFHSLEDRLVKQAFRGDPRLRILTKRVIRPSAEEIRRNPRARSARLRVAERCEL
ncbi:16S rRNA (cytosine(1402)-N(4))-methyltransferase RsmH [Thermosulfurimonas marina]|uniref:Ribosomal RNA small subunit methyltransferase H n=1 Tax=Thermosulfurimonas marina TaxID=2047767 RepID=A0A6H1WRB9_9BACT|nr:16S rRNA (cytosine(1402)-N(4))-methyltransferase RsmH [Thermosulfurimonas marina]QJA05765.1 16S rRNA (cytosine(1402)-N(4))-methyltransferase RsmH [Thermosulfurimonas marina]